MEETTTTKDLVPVGYRERYKSTGGTCGDFIGTELQRVAADGPGSLASVVSENGIDPNRWAHLNFGMQRMNLANVLRSRFLNGEVISILGKQYDLSVMKADYNGTIEDTVESLTKFAAWANLQDTGRTISALRKAMFPGEPKPSAAEKAAERAAAKAEKEAERAAAKAEKEAERAAAKAAKEAERAAAKAAKEAAAKAKAAKE